MGRRKCREKFHITQESLPLEIRKSGVYQIDEDLHWGANVAPAITIAADSVTIKGKHHTIDQRGVGTQAFAANNVRQLRIQDVNIKNGALAPLQPFIIPGFGPVPPSPDTVAAAVRLRGCQNVTLKGLNIDQVLYGVVGTEMIGHVLVKKCQIHNFGLAPPSPGVTQPVGGALILAGTAAQNQVDVVIDKCQFQSQTGYNAILLHYTNGGEVRGCDNTAGRLGTVGQTLGCFTATYSKSISWKNCTGRYNTQPFFALRSSGIDVYDCESRFNNHNGLEFVFCDNCTVDKFVTHAQLTGDPLDFLGSGIKISGCNFCVVENCVATGYTIGSLPTDSNGAGIAVSGSKNCTIQNNKVNGNNFGIKEVVTIPIGPPPVVVGAPSTYLSNVAVGNFLQAYLGLDPALITTTPSAAPNSFYNVAVAVAP